jgi:hypothetical protein
LAAQNGTICAQGKSFFSSANPHNYMKRAEAKILENRKEIPVSEPDQNPDTMEYRPLGKSWIEASVVSFGAWAIGGWSWGGTN